jgi:hypothetical protein
LQKTLWDNGQVIARGKSERTRISRFPIIKSRWIHSWLSGASSSSVEISYEAGWFLSESMFAHQWKKVQVRSELPALLNFSADTDPLAALRSYGLKFALIGSREQIEDEMGTPLLTRVPVWKHGEITQGIIDRFLWNPKLAVADVPCLIELLRFASGEVWKGYRLP